MLQPGHLPLVDPAARALRRLLRLQYVLAGEEAAAYEYHTPGHRSGLHDLINNGGGGEAGAFGGGAGAGAGAGAALEGASGGDAAAAASDSRQRLHPLQVAHNSAVYAQALTTLLEKSLLPLLHASQAALRNTNEVVQPRMHSPLPFAVTINVTNAARSFLCVEQSAGLLSRRQCSSQSAAHCSVWCAPR